MTDAGLETIVAGVRCREVLAELSEYLDGTLPAERVLELQRHLAACDRCSRFGGEIADVLQRLRDGQRVHAPVDVVDVVLARIGTA